MSAIAHVVALGTFVVAAWGYIVQRRQFPPVYFTWEAIAQSTQPDENVHHVVEFHNISRAPAVILSMFFSGGRPELKDDFRAPETLAAGGSFQLLATARQLEDAWFRITWQTVSDRGEVHVGWGAVLPHGALGLRQRQEADAWYKRPFPSRLLSHIRGSEIGPGAAPQATVGRATRFPKRLTKEMTPAEGTAPWFSAKAGGGAIELAYVEPARPGC